MANVVFNAFKVNVNGGNIDLENDTFKVMLVTSSYTADKDNHDFRDDITNEVVGAGYVAGGETLSGISLTQDNPNDRAVWDANNVSWPSSTITARGAVVYKSRGGAASADELCAYFDFGSDKTSTTSIFTLAWHADGILLLGES